MTPSSLRTPTPVLRLPPLLDALAQLEDAQVGLRMLRSCAGYTRLVHSMRCTPPTCQREALQRFDSLVCSSLAGITGLHPRSLGKRRGPSLRLALDLGLLRVMRLLPTLPLAPLATDPYVLRAFRPRLRLPLPQSRKPSPPLPRKPASASTPRPPRLSGVPCFSLRLSLAREPSLLLARLGARAWTLLFLWPSQRLMPDAASDLWCPQCRVLDRFSLRAGTCVAGGERNQRFVISFILGRSGRACNRRRSDPGSSSRKGLKTPAWPNDALQMSIC